MRPGQAPKEPESPIWLIFRLLAPVIVGFAVVAVVVGLVTSQPLIFVLIDVMTAIVGVILLLTVRWRR